MPTSPKLDADRLGGRLPLLAPADLDDAQRQLYDGLARLVVPEAAERGFTARLDDGRFIGPFNAMLRVPEIAAGMGQWTSQIAAAGLDSLAFRNAQRLRLLELAERGGLTVPMAGTLPLSAAQEAFAVLRSEHPGGKLALIPG